MPTIRELQPEDLQYLATHLRDCDKEELKYATGQPTLVALAESAAMSLETWVVDADGFPIAIFGLAEAEGGLDNIGVPWMLATPEIDNHKQFFARASLHYRDEYQSKFPVLTNYVYSNNVHAIEWLKWLGFEFDEPRMLGPAYKPFQQFMRVRNV